MKPIAFFLSLLGLAVVLTFLGHGPQASPGPKNLSKLVPTASTIKTFSDVAKPRLDDTYGKLPLSFEANHGQTDRRVKFLTRGSGYSLFLTSNETVLSLRKPTAPAAHRRIDTVAMRREVAENRAITTTVLRMRLVGANPAAEISGLEELPGKSNYFIGNYPKEWRTNVPNYARVKYRNIYPGVDLLYYGNQRQLEYDFVVRPGADPSRIALGVQGADRLEVDAQGDLVLDTAVGPIHQRKPVIYQEIDGDRKEIAGAYVLTGRHQVGFRVAAYDASQPLVIDPVLVYSTFLGGSGLDQGFGIAVDATGNAYVTGVTVSIPFPTVTGAFQTTSGGSQDVFVTKLNPAGSALVYSTYVGGSGDDGGLGIAVDSLGNAYVTGFTTSTNFPTTAAAFQTTLRGLSAAFVTKLNPTGSGLVYSTYLGGSSHDPGVGFDGGPSPENGRGIAVDSLGNAYVLGRTHSSDFPTTPGAFQTTLRGRENAYVTKLDLTGSTLLYSTYLGGNDRDEGFGIAVDALFNAYVTGGTLSGDFPTTPGVFEPTWPCRFGGKAFVTKLDPTGSALVYSSFLGGFCAETRCNAIAVDALGNAYVTGETGSGSELQNGGSLQTTPGAFQPTFAGGNRDAFVTKVNPTGSGLVYSTYLGGRNDDFGRGIAVDGLGNAYVTGYTNSGDTNPPCCGNVPFPTTPGAFQTNNGGFSFQFDAFMTILNPTGSALVYSTYLGGSGVDQGFGIAVDASGNAYVTGLTASTDFPTTPGAFQTTFRGGTQDAFVAKFGAATPTIQSTTLAFTAASATTSDFDDAALVQARLTKTSDGTPVPGEMITFTLGSGSGAPTCSAVTDATGTATCSLTPNQPAGTFTLTATFAGDSTFGPSSASTTFTVTKEETVTKFTATSPTVLANGMPAAFSATLKEDGVTPISGRTLTFTLGSGAGAQSCSGTTDATGTASCSIVVNQPLGPNTVAANFASDAFFRPSSDTEAVFVFAFLGGGAGGSFVIGNLNSAVGTAVTFWGTQWAKVNSLSGGPAPAAFKGFADMTSTTPPACGGSWTSRPGNSSNPPDSVPPFMAVIASSSITKSGATISGDVPKIVIVKTNPGYGPSPGQAGTGTVVAVLCP